MTRRRRDAERTKRALRRHAREAAEQRELFGEPPKAAVDHGGNLHGVEPEPEPAPEPLPPSRRPGTSRAAAASMVGSAATCRRRILELLEQAGRDGLTCDELEEATGYAHQNASARVWELRGNPRNSERPRLVVESGRRRATRSGRQAIVWVLADSAVSAD